jgi:hypothetical protein
LSISFKKANFFQLSRSEQIESLKVFISGYMVNHPDVFEVDISHISTAAVFDGGLQLDDIEWIKEDLFRLHYHYNWSIAWTCSGVQEGGQINEKVRFSVSVVDTETVSINFKFLVLER